MKKKAAKSKAGPKQFLVPMRLTLQGHACIDAESAEEAIEKAERDGGMDLNTAECVDLEITGDAEQS